MSILEFDLDKSSFRLSEASLSGARVYLKTLPDSSSNMAFIINYFQKNKTDTTTHKTPRAFSLKIDEFSLQGAAFRYRSLLPANPSGNAPKGVTGNPAEPGAISFLDLDISGLHTEIRDFSTNGKEITGSIERFEFREKSGFVLKQLSAELSFGSGKITLEDLLLETPSSRISDYLSFTFDTLADFNDFEQKVIMEGHFENSLVAASDIARFAPGLRKVGLTAGIDGTVTGSVADLRARNLLITLGNSTYFRGNYHVHGLPDLEQTRLQLDFNTLSTNKQDIEYILARVSDKPPVLPEFLEEAGDIYFSGDFEGKFDDFTAGGELKTSLGQITGEAKIGRASCRERVCQYV